MRNSITAKLVLVLISGFLAGMVYMGMSGTPKEAKAAVSSCKQWEVAVAFFEAGGHPESIPAGFEPFAGVVTSKAQVLMRRCVD
jgi:hypothetical protein